MTQPRHNITRNAYNFLYSKQTHVLVQTDMNMNVSIITWFLYSPAKKLVFVPVVWRCSNGNLVLASNAQ